MSKIGIALLFNVVIDNPTVLFKPDFQAAQTNIVGNVLETELVCFDLITQGFQLRD